MKEPMFKLTLVGPCDNPRCRRPVYAELTGAPEGLRLCVECRERVDRLRAIGERTRGFCSEACRQR